MSKKYLAVLPLLCVMAVAMSGDVTAPTAPTSPVVLAPTDPATCEPPAPDPEWGACRWYCGSKSYSTRAQCQANCSVPCEDIC